MRVHSPLVDRYAVDLVDTPGTGSVYAHNTAQAQAALGTLDAAVLVVTVDPPMTQAERELLTQIVDRSVQTFVVLNKVDRLDEDELSEALSFTEAVCADATGRRLPVLPCSSRWGGEDPGFGAFVDVLTDYLRRRGRLDARVALHGHALTVLQRMLDEARLALRGRELVAQGRGEDVATLRDRLASIAAARSEIRDRSAGSVRRLRGELDEAAGSASVEFTSRCRQDVGSTWDEVPQGVPVAEVEARARQVLEDSVTFAVEQWRAVTRERLENGLAKVAERANADLAAQLELARGAVRQLLDLDLAEGWGPVVLAPQADFRYDFALPVGWAPPVKVSSLGTARQRRERVRRAIAAEVGLLTDRQVGRARSDLQKRLDESGQALGKSLDQRFAQTIDRLRDAINSMGAGEGDESEQRAALVSRVGKLQDLVARLEVDVPL